MTKAKIIEKLAKQSNVTPAAAADQVDQVVNDILERLRKGQTASLPGLGSFRGERGALKFDPVRPNKIKQGAR